MKLQNKIRHGIIVLKTLCFRALEWAKEHHELVTYVIFGGLTTVVDWGISFVLYQTDMNTHVVNVIAWTAAVLFAFVTNKIWVFRSQTKAASRVLGELITFAGGRVLSLGGQELLFVLTVDILDWNRSLVKIPVAVLVVIINYFLTKFVFRKKQDTVPQQTEKDSRPATAARVKGRAIVIGGAKAEPVIEDSVPCEAISEPQAPETGDAIPQSKGDSQ